MGPGGWQFADHEAPEREPIAEPIAELRAAVVGVWWCLLILAATLAWWALWR